MVQSRWRATILKGQTMKPKSALLLLLVAFGTALLSVDTHSAERQRVFHSEANGYSVTIPEGWKQVPNDVLENSINMTLTGEGRRAYNFEAAIATDSTDRWLDYPYLLIQVIRYSGFVGKQDLKKNEIAYFLKAITGLDVDNAAQEARKNLSDGMQSMVSDQTIGRVSFDEERMVYRFGVQSEIADVGKIQSSAVGHIGRYASVQLMFCCLESDWSRFENERNLMFDSFLFDQGMRYQEGVKHIKQNRSGGREGLGLHFDCCGSWANFRIAKVAVQLGTLSQ